MPRFRLPIRQLCAVLCGVSLFFSLWLGHPFSNSSPAQAIDAQQLVKMGVEQYQTGHFLAAIKPWRLAYEVYQNTQDFNALAIVSENLARAYRQMGHTSEEINYWDDAITTMQIIGDQQKLGRLLTEQAQAYNRMGQHRRAMALLCGTTLEMREPPSEITECNVNSALRQAHRSNDIPGQVTALGSLGEAYRSSGNVLTAIDYLQQGYRLSQTLETPELEASLLNSLGNASATLALSNYRRAQEAATQGALDTLDLQQKAEQANQQSIDYLKASYYLAVAQQAYETQLSALLGLMAAHKRIDDVAAVHRYQTLALLAMQQLPDTKTKAFAAIRLADLLVSNQFSQPLSTSSDIPLSAATEAKALLQQAFEIGTMIDNPRVKSFSLGKLGRLEEQAGHYGAAIKKTQQARLEADQNRAAHDSLYLWEWQLGRIYKAQGNFTAANQAYGQAVALLEEIQNDIFSTNRDLQGDFRNTVEPIYREYANLSLTTVPKQVTVKQGAKAFKELETALATLESLKVAELQSYFANDCVIVPANIETDATTSKVAENTATGIFSTAIFEDKLTVILSLPKAGKKVIQVPVAVDQVEAKVNEFRRGLELGRRNYSFDIQSAQQIYRWIIEPFEPDLINVKTLVFVNDGLLRSVPMAALHDGNQFLIERYAVAVTPSLTLTTPKKVERTALSALLLGVSRSSQVSSRRDIDSLPAVERELNLLANQLTRTKTLLNEEFSIKAVQTALIENDYRILHIATHGNFGFEPEDNYVVAGAKDDAGFNETLTISQLGEIIDSIDDDTRDPIELLTLTACNTAAIGGTQSTLGFAGVAVRAGVQSAIATLWAVSDDSTPEIVAEFYQQLQNPMLTKAKALQQAQIAMLQSGDIVKSLPYNWAPFILIGNWL